MANATTKSHSFEIDNPPKNPTACLSTTPSVSNLDPTKNPPLIFTHGASGTFSSPAMQNFADGFAPLYPITSFNGSMNLSSRTTQFGAVLAHHGIAGASASRLGGRSMGARAAIMAATEYTTHLVLASYPLRSGDAVRDQILLGIHPDVKVVFVSGDRDGMCPLPELEAVRRRMQAKTWKVVVRGADHGMEVKPRKATAAVGRMVGEVVAGWMLGREWEGTEGEVSWDEETGQARWRGRSVPIPSKAKAKAKAKAAEVAPKQTPKSKKRMVEDALPPTEDSATTSTVSKKRKGERASGTEDDAPRNTRRSTRIKAKIMK